MAKIKQNGLKSANSSNISLYRLFRPELKAIKNKPQRKIFSVVFAY
jgi:hypothetical protein